MLEVAGTGTKIGLEIKVYVIEAGYLLLIIGTFGEPPIDLLLMGLIYKRF